MEMHWWCCDCDATNSSPDDDHLVCSREGCGHHLCSDCYNPQQIGRDGHLNDHVGVTTTTTIYKSVVNDAKYEKHKAKQSRNHMFKSARRLIGHHMKHSRIGRKVLSFWSYVQRKTGRKKDKLRIEAKKPTVVVVQPKPQTVVEKVVEKPAPKPNPPKANNPAAAPKANNPPKAAGAGPKAVVAAASNFENLPSTSHYYDPQGITQYVEDSYGQLQETTQYTGESYEPQEQAEYTGEYTGESYQPQQQFGWTGEYTGESYQPHYTTSNYQGQGSNQYSEDYYYYY